MAKQTGNCKGKTLDFLNNPPCTCAINCHTCEYTVGGGETGPNDCTKCKNQQYLLNGACVEGEECEFAGLSPVGEGNYNRRCEEGTDDDAACVRKTDGCHICADDGSACTMYGALVFGRMIVGSRRRHLSSIAIFVLASLRATQQHAFHRWR